MTDKVFLNSLANDRIDIIQKLLDILSRGGIDYCVIGGLAINACVDPIVSIDLDIVVAAGELEKLKEIASSIFEIKELQGKVWAYSDDSRRKSKRQKYLADIFRIIETYPYMIKQLPGNIKQII